MAILREMSNGAKSLLFTTLFCIVIAFTTQSIWPSSIYEHLAISFGFGYSAVFSAHLISWLKPELSTRLVNLLSLSAAMILGTSNAYYWLSAYGEFLHVGSMKSVVFLGFIFTAVCFFYFYAHEQKLMAQKELEKSRRKQSEQDKALIQAQLRQLQSQIEPHFLFNTLANVSALIEHDPKSAKLMLEKLTELLRGTLKNSRSDTSTIASELSVVEAYLAIQKVRLGDRLNYTITNQLGGELSFPPLIIQSLVENAIQHGIEPKENGGFVSIDVFQKGESLLLKVVDNGVGLAKQSTHNGSGVGISNTQQRLSGLYGTQASLKISESQTGGVTALVSIPLAELELA